MSEADEFYQRAVDLVVREQRASTSFVQRSFRLQYNIAAKIMERMEAEGIITAPNHVGKRRILMEN